MRVLVFLLVLSDVAGAALEQLSWRAVDPRGKAPMAGGIVMAAAEMEVTTEGALAVTRVAFELEWRGEDRAEVLMRIPVRPGQTVTGFRWQLPDDEVREGVGVGKSIGSRAYESVVSRKIDPGLVEWESEGVLRVHLFPFAKGDRKWVEFEFAGPMRPAGERWQYWSPVRFEKPLAWACERDIDPAASGKPAFEIPWEGRAPMVSVEPRAGERFIAGALVGGVGARLLEKPQQLLLAVDVSASARSRDVAAEVAVIEALAAEGGCEVELVFFSMAVHSREVFRLPEQRAGLLRALENALCDGGTDFGVLEFAESEADLAVISTDGEGTLGMGAVSAGDMPVAVLDSISAAPSGAGKRLAKAGGGTYVHLDGDDGDAALSLRRFGNFGSAVVGDTRLEDVHLSDLGDGVWWLAARLPDAVDGGELAFGEEGDRKRVTLRPGAGRNFALWAAAEAVAGVGGKAENDVRAGIAVEAGIVSPWSSLIVLERWWDYERWKIELPPGMRRKPRQPLMVAQIRAGQVAVQSEELADLSRFNDWWSDPVGGKVAKRFAQRVIDTEFAQKEGSRDLWAWMADPKETVATVRERQVRLVEHQNKVMRALAARRGDALKEMRDAVGRGDEKGAAAAADELRSAADNWFQMDWYWPWNGSMVPLDLDGVEIDTQIQQTLEMIEIFRTNMRSGGNAPVMPPMQRFSEAIFGGGGGGAVSDDPFAAADSAGADPERPSEDLAVVEVVEIGALASLDGDAWELAYRDAMTEAREVAWYLAVALALAERGDSERAMRVLTAVAERWPNDLARLRVVGWRLLEIGAFETAVAVFERAAMIAGDASTARDLGLALGAAGQKGEAAIALYRAAGAPGVPDDWSGRTSALLEMNRALWLEKGQAKTEVAMDLRVVLEWDREDVDLDLVVIDPNFEKLTAGTPCGPEGAVVPDNSSGLGPEELWSKIAVAGAHEIRIRRREGGVQGDCVARLTVYRDFVGPNENVETKIVKVPGGAGVVRVGEWTVKD